VDVAQLVADHAEAQLLFGEETALSRQLYAKSSNCFGLYEFLHLLFLFPPNFSFEEYLLPFFNVFFFDEDIVEVFEELLIFSEFAH
jgi:hypothetical protein